VDHSGLTQVILHDRLAGDAIAGDAKIAGAAERAIVTRETWWRTENRAHAPAVYG
jgi:hypothetical protein